MTRPRLLDLFCGAGGCSVGYYRAGFDVVGVDIAPQPNYPYEFYQEDALAFLADIDWASPSHPVGNDDPGGFDAIHASPPCQVNSTISKWKAMGRSGNPEENGHRDLITQTRRLLHTTGLPSVIENVPGARMRRDLILCGSQFGLSVRRHRWFEFGGLTPPLASPCMHRPGTVGVYGHGGDTYHTVQEWREAMGIDWMTRKEMAQAIPPAYTEFIGAEVLRQIRAAA